MRDDWCSVVAQEAELPLVGTAPCTTGFLLVEWPRPWPARLEDVAELGPVHGALARSGAAGRSVRLQLIGTRETGATSRVALFARPSTSGPFALVGEEQVERHAVPATVIDLLDRPVSALRSPTRELLVCGNGARDVCCGSLGVRVADRASEVFAGNVWRTSHTGGHRFAPTGFTLPDGAFWGRLDDGAVEAILRRDVPVSTVLDHFRGSALHCDPAVQAAEQAVLGIVGWSLLDAPRSAVTVTDPDGTKRILYHYRDADGNDAAFRAVLGGGAEVTVPGCRAGAPVTQRTYEVRMIERVMAKASGVG
jgi:hypothetical protein